MPYVPTKNGSNRNAIQYNSLGLSKIKEHPY
jgi:hypothetical protein